MFFRILALFLLTPVVELALLIKLGDVIGFWPTVGIIFVTGVTGTYLAKREGLSVWKRFNERLQGGGLPGTELVDGVIILLSGALLITPGVLTDLAGFLGLLPVTRRFIRAFAMRKLKQSMEKGSIQMRFGGFGTSPFEGGATGPNTETSWQGEPRENPRSTEAPRTYPGDQPG